MAEITLDDLIALSGRSNTLITVDAPFLGNVLIFNGRILNRGDYVEPEKIGTTLGFPAPDRILAEATRFWIQDVRGVRQMKTRAEIAGMVKTPARMAMRAPVDA